MYQNNHKIHIHISDNLHFKTLFERLFPGFTKGCHLKPERSVLILDYK